MDISLFQDQTATAASGDQILGVCMVSCGLVFGFYNGGRVACFHWPGFGASDEHMNKFVRIIGGTPDSVAVVTNEPGDNFGSYQQTIKMIYERYNRRVPIRYYSNSETRNGGTIAVVLGTDGIDLERTNSRASDVSRLDPVMEYEPDNWYWAE